MIKNLKKAFTIIELVIVIAVIAILAAVMIPTYSSLVEKANQSADIQAVKQMNTILKADEATNGVPANVEEVKEILRNNNMSNYNPMVDSYLFSWDPESNTIILINKNTNQAEYPSNFAKKTYLANWELLDGKVNVTMAQLGANNLEEALKKIDSNQTIKLSENATLSENPVNITENTNDYSIDLNGHTLTMSYNQSIYVKEGGNAKITNGTIILSGTSALVSVASGASIILQDVTLKNDTKKSGAIFLSGDNSRCDMKNCIIETSVPVQTNASGGKYGEGVVLNMYNCTLGNADNWTYTGLLLNVKGNYNIYNSTIYSEDQCIFNRCGEIYVENTECNYIPYSWSGKNGEWGSGNDAYIAPIVVGDWSKSYNNDAKCILVNVKINVDTSKVESYNRPNVFISQDGNNKASLICGDTISWEVCNYSTSGITFGNVYVNGVAQSQGAKSNN